MYVVITYPMFDYMAKVGNTIDSLWVFIMDFGTCCIQDLILKYAG